MLPPWACTGRGGLWIIWSLAGQKSGGADDVQGLRRSGLRLGPADLFALHQSVPAYSLSTQSFESTKQEMEWLATGSSREQEGLSLDHWYSRRS